MTTTKNEDVDAQTVAIGSAIETAESSPKKKHKMKKEKRDRERAALLDGESTDAAAYVARCERYDFVRTQKVDF